MACSIVPKRRNTIPPWHREGEPTAPACAPARTNCYFFQAVILTSAPSSSAVETP